MHKWAHAKVALVAVVAFALIFIFVKGHTADTHVLNETPYIEGGTLNYVKAVAFWHMYIETHGGESAFDELLVRGALLGPDQHSFAHAFGEALYSTHGVSGIQWCRSDFVYGCYHQFIASAIAERGEAIAQILYEECVGREDDAWSCLHGVGHGLLSHRGYQLPDLQQTLAVCKTLEPDRWSGCADGAFMEYNLRLLTALDDREPEVRPLSAETRHEPCNDIDPFFEHLCVEELTRWWMHSVDVEGAHAHEHIARMGGYCQHYENENMRICYQGIGTQIARGIYNFDPHTLKTLCEASSAHSRDQALCMTGGVRVAHVRQYPQASENICAGMGFSGKWLEYCTVFGDFASREDPAPAGPVALSPH